MPVTRNISVKALYMSVIELNRSSVALNRSVVALNRSVVVLNRRVYSFTIWSKEGMQLYAVQSILH